jgi:hypothetical protein
MRVEINCGHYETHAAYGWLGSNVAYYFFQQSDLGWKLFGTFP